MLQICYKLIVIQNQGYLTSKIWKIVDWMNKD